MRIRAWRAFASNNSGSYVLVGRFDAPGDAAQLAAELAPVLAAHDAWYRDFERWAEAPPEDTPLQGLIAREGLTPDARAGASDDWPEHGQAPGVASVGQQVLLYADYTVTMPRLFGELIYRRGGRVGLELDHTHALLATRFNFWTEHYDADEPALAALLAELRARAAPPRRPPIQPIARQGAWDGELEYTSLPQDPVAEVNAIAAIASRYGLRVRLKLLELEDGVDPLAGLRDPARDAAT